MIEIIKLKKDKTPLVLEVNVPPLCKPLLIGNPRESKLLRWVESPSNRSTVLTWGLDSSVEEIVEKMLEMTIERSSLEGWGVVQPDLPSAISRIKDMGIEEYESSEGLVFPKDPSILGSIIVVKDRFFPVIHNVKRGICVVS